MSYTTEQWRFAITNLLKMTSANQIRWELTQIEDGDAWTNIDRSLMAQIDNKAYVISKTRTKYYFDENEYTWNGSFIFSVFEYIGNNTYEKIATAPEISALAGLFDAAENNMAFNRNALGGLL